MTNIKKGTGIKMIKISGYVPKKFFPWFTKAYRKAEREDKIMLRLVQIDEAKE